MAIDRSSAADVRAALVQQLESDRLLGVRSVPVPVALLQAVANQDRPSATHRDQAERVPIPRESARTLSAKSASSADVHSKAERLRILDESQVKGCKKCILHAERTNTVFGQGNPDARLVFIGEGPGYDEDKQGLAFVGKAGQLLTKMIAAMGLTRDEVYICNVVKCRPPGNRTPTADEILACNPYLQEQLNTIQPEMIVALGAPAAKTVLHTAESIGRLRGRFHEYFYSGSPGVGPSVPVMPTFHPAYLLRSPDEKRKAWDDLQMVMERMGLPKDKKPETRD